MLQEKHYLILGIIFLYTTIICMFIVIMDESLKSRYGIIIGYLILFLLGLSAFFINITRKPNKNDYNFSLFLIIFISLSSLLLLILHITSINNLSLHHWVAVLFLWFFILMYTSPIFINFKKNKAI